MLTQHSWSKIYIWIIALCIWFLKWLDYGFYLGLLSHWSEHVPFIVSSVRIPCLVFTWIFLPLSKNSFSTVVNFVMWRRHFCDDILPVQQGRGSGGGNHSSCWYSILITDRLDTACLCHQISQLQFVWWGLTAIHTLLRIEIIHSIWNVAIHFAYGQFSNISIPLSTKSLNVLWLKFKAEFANI